MVVGQFEMSFNCKPNLKDRLTLWNECSIYDHNKDT